MTNELVSVTPDARRLLAPGGKPFFAVIVNYVGHSDRAWAQFQPGKFDASLIESDFRRARAAGANTVRTFVTSPLQNEFPRGDWTKLDALVNAAERAGIYLWLTLADYSLSYVQTLAAHARLIAERYAGRPGILAYDLRNEPRFYHMALMRYQQPTPLYAPALVDEYPPARSADQALAWARGEGKAPASLSDAEAIAYANVSEILDAFLKAVSEWISAHSYQVSVADFIRSSQAAPWEGFITALDGTLARWLEPQLTAVRGADPGRLVTVGYSDPLLAALPANRALDLHAINRYPRDASPRQLEYQFTIVRGLQEAFPAKPVVLSEIGYSTDTLEPAQAGVCEAAAWLRAYEMGLSGAGKWMLWDLPPGPNQRERSFGLFDAGGNPKPSALVLPAISARIAPSREARGVLEISAGEGGGVTYRFTADDARFSSGYGRAGDAALRWEGAGWGQVLANWTEPGALGIWTSAPGRVTADLGELLGMRELGDYTFQDEDGPRAHTRAGSVVVFDAAPGTPAALRFALASVDARIAVVWPHADAPVSEARLCNITAHLTFPDSRQAVPCDFAPEVILWRALNNEPAEPIATGVRRMARLAGRRVPVWDFNDVDVSPARNPENKLYFSVRLPGSPHRSNVWVHGSDARTYMPVQAQATGIRFVRAANPPPEVDARIQILWPHGGAAASQAHLANIKVDLFERGSLRRLAPARGVADAWAPEVWLVSALNNDPGRRIGRGAVQLDTGGSAHWEFNDVDISAARNPNSKLHFWIEVTQTLTYSNFWTHGVDARTYLPNPDILLGDCPE